MKAILLLAGMLTLTGIPANAGTQIFVRIGGGYHGSYFGATGSRCAYSAGCFSPYRSYGCIGYPGYFYGGYGYSYGGYSGGYYPVSYDTISYAPNYVQPAPAPSVTAPSPVTAPAPSSASTVPPPAQAQLPFGILDVNGFVHSPYSDAIFKVPGVRNAQMVYDPVTGKPFLVR